MKIYNKNSDFRWNLFGYLLHEYKVRHVKEKYKDNIILEI